MSTGKIFTKVQFYCSLRAIIKGLFSDHAQTEEDAVALISAGVVQVNDKVVDDSYYGISHGKCTIKVGRDQDRINVMVGQEMDKKILAFANRPSRVKRLLAGELLRMVQPETESSKRGVWIISAIPPEFSGPEICACWSGDLNIGFPRRDSFEKKASGMTECGAFRP